MAQSFKIINVVAARPNFIKMAPIMSAYQRCSAIEPVLVHCGQHYDRAMSGLFFEELNMPKPDINLGVGSGSHAVQTAQVMMAFEEVVLREQPNAIMVVGDVNSTLACGLVAAKLGVELIHVEAGLRSGDRSMPEEINRLAVDAISQVLFCTEQSGVDHLRQEGRSSDDIFLVGNVMIDTLQQHVKRAAQSNVLEQYDVQRGQYVLVTLHRPANVEDQAFCVEMIQTLEKIAHDQPVLFPCHPRTRQNFQQWGLADRLDQINGVHLLEPQGYIDFLQLTRSAKLVVTDSGGIQEETTALKVPCLTLRDNTERPVTVTLGSNQLIGRNPTELLNVYQTMKQGGASVRSKVPPLWDGRTAERIVDLIAERYELTQTARRAA